MTTELLRLAELCEQASGPDRELDAEIAKALGYEVEWATIGPDHRREELVQVRTYPGEAGPTSRNLRRYSSSLDAAMTLVPEAYSVRDLCDWTKEPSISPHWSVGLTNGKRYHHIEGDAATPALALCAAALRARSQESNHG